MNKTKIEWVQNPDGTPGYSWNPITGCLNNCPYCYARKLANTRLRERYLANDNIANPMRTGRRDDIEEEAMEILSNPFYPRFWDDRLAKGEDFLFSSMWRRYTKPVGVFVCDMSDLFGIGIPEDWTNKVLQTIKDASAHSSHRFYLLTKQPQNLAKFSPFPDNVYLGVSATNQHQFDEAVKYLKEVEATVKYISFEPLLERISVE